ncbi:MAG: hypothetical protein ACR2GK_00875 [Gemmatimonadaceae bacterium]
MSTANRRRFLGTSARLAAAVTGALAVPFSVSDADSLEQWLASNGSWSLSDPRSDDAVARDETYWARVRGLYSLDKEVLNFDHGWTNPAPASAVEELTRSARLLEALPAEQLPGMWEGYPQKRFPRWSPIFLTGLLHPPAVTHLKFPTISGCHA